MRSFITLQCKYLEGDDPFPLVCETDSTMPGLAVGRNPKWVKVGPPAPRFAVFHVKSATVVQAVKGETRAWEILTAIAPLADWTLPQERMTFDMVMPACKVCRKMAK
jgi:hypothetical protein